mmetsp:Transcript_137925/g.440445  ORF Transcript_137925/g.440445 Transcript_137925/m.440445 type:complete len:368 (-) Transcript_137925:361-1464(-)
MRSQTPRLASPRRRCRTIASSWSMKTGTSRVGLRASLKGHSLLRTFTPTAHWTTASARSTLAERVALLRSMAIKTTRGGRRSSWRGPILWKTLSQWVHGTTTSARWWCTTANHRRAPARTTGATGGKANHRRAPARTTGATGGKANRRRVPARTTGTTRGKVPLPPSPPRRPPPRRLRRRPRQRVRRQRRAGGLSTRSQAGSGPKRRLWPCHLLHRSHRLRCRRPRRRRCHRRLQELPRPKFRQRQPPALTVAFSATSGVDSRATSLRAPTRRRNRHPRRSHRRRSRPRQSRRWPRQRRPRHRCRLPGCLRRRRRHGLRRQSRRRRRRRGDLALHHGNRLQIRTNPSGLRRSRSKDGRTYQHGPGSI